MIRPSWELPVGRWTLMERVRKVFKGRYQFIHSFPELPLGAESQSEKKMSGWFINGAVLWKKFPVVHKDEFGEIDGVPVFFYAENLSREDLKHPERLNEFLVKRKRISLNEKGSYLKYIYQFIQLQAEVLLNDLKQISKDNTDKTKLPEDVIVLGNERDLLIEEGAELSPASVFDVRKGPVYISSGAKVSPLSHVQGPCYIGPDVLVDNAKIRGGSSFFEGCRLSGEIEESIFLEYVNKHHDGFIGHSFVGSFVNFGAMSTNSDLKNNYSPIKLFLNQEWVDTQEIKLGAFIGDHSKLGIGSLINTGTIIGLGVNMFFSGNMYPKAVPSFAWGGKYPFQKYRLSEFLENTDKIMKRRNRNLSQGEAEVIKWLYQSIQEQNYEAL